MKITQMTSRAIIWIFFLLYCGLLLKVILFKYPYGVIVDMLKPTHHLSLGFRIVHSNFIPLKTIAYYLLGNESVGIAKANIVGNILAFGPMGFLLPILISKWNRLKSAAVIAFFVSFTFEIIQLVTAIGEFDVDDIILNVLGAVLGFAVYKTMSVWLWSNKGK